MNFVGIQSLTGSEMQEEGRASQALARETGAGKMGPWDGESETRVWYIGGGGGRQPHRRRRDDRESVIGGDLGLILFPPTLQKKN